ncbi:MAG: clostripain-related cysteine peptidase [Desulfobacterales bacterium]|nr:clostripain-related cysteine peptidase [Desulfobacterales bacterium]
MMIEQNNRVTDDGRRFPWLAGYLSVLCISLFLLLGNARAMAAAPEQLAELGAPVLDSQRQWTLMVYLDGDNDLEKFALLDLNEMEQGLPESGVTVVALVDRAQGYDDSDGDWQGCRVYRLRRDRDPEKLASEQIAELGELNMGDPAVLSAFVTGAVRKFPAPHYGIILWDHGGGWSLMAIDHSAPGTEKGMDSLNLPELRQGLSRALDRLGLERLDLVGFDMCLMAQLETAYELAGLARVMVASQAVEPGDGWPYDRFLPMFGRETAGVKRLATNIVKAYDDYYSERKERVATLSAIDLDAIDGVVAAVDGMAGKLTGVLERRWPDIARSLFYSETYGDRTDIRRDARVLSSIDLLDLGKRLRHEIPDFPAAAEYRRLVAAMDQAVLANYSSPRHHLSNGLALYAPVTARQFNNAYSGLRLARRSGWGRFLQDLHAVQQKHLVKPKIVDLRVIDARSGKPVQGGVPGGGFKIVATVRGENVLWVQSVHGKRVSNNGGGVIFFEKGYVLDPDFYKKKEDAVADVVDLLMPEFKGRENQVSQEYVGRHFWITDGAQAARATVDASNLDDLRHVSVPVLIKRKKLGEHFARVFFDTITWQAVDVRWEIDQPDGSVAYRSIQPRPEDEVTLLYEFIADTPGGVNFLKSETLHWRDGLELLIGNDPPEELLVGMRAESMGGQSAFATTKITIQPYDKQQQGYLDNAGKVTAEHLIGRWRWYGMTGGAGQGWKPLPTYVDISRSKSNKKVLVAKINNPRDPDWQVVPQMALLDTRLAPTLRLISFDNDGNPVEAVNFTFLVSRWENGSPRLILKYLTPKGWLVLWVKEDGGRPQPGPAAQGGAPVATPAVQSPPAGGYGQQQHAPQAVSPQGGGLTGSWQGQEGDTLVFSGNRYQVSEYGEVVDAGVFQVQGGRLITQSQLTGMGMAYGMQLQGNTLLLREMASGLVYQYQRQGQGGQQQVYAAQGGQPGQVGTTGQEMMLQGKLCSYSGSSNYYSGASSSSSSWAYFDGRGNMQYGSESSMSGGGGGYYNASPTTRGRYRVQGETIYMQFGDGSSGTATVYTRGSNGRINALTFEGTIYAQQLCE